MRFLRTLPFRIYIPSMLSDTRDKKFKPYVSLHLPEKAVMFKYHLLWAVWEWESTSKFVLIFLWANFKKLFFAAQSNFRVIFSLSLPSFASSCHVLVTFSRLLRSTIGLLTINIHFFLFCARLSSAKGNNVRGFEGNFLLLFSQSIIIYCLQNEALREPYQQVCSRNVFFSFCVCR